MRVSDIIFPYILLPVFTIYSLLHLVHGIFLSEKLSYGNRDRWPKFTVIHLFHTIRIQ